MAAWAVPLTVHWCHPQINAVSLYLLYLVEMTSSGLQIIYNTDEVGRPRVGGRLGGFLTLLISFTESGLLCRSCTQTRDWGSCVRKC